MHFESEAERMQHPTARLIPKAVWDDFFINQAVEFSEAHQDILSKPWEEIKPQLKNFSTSNDKYILSLWICCALRMPSEKADDLMAAASSLHLQNPPEQLFLMSAFIGQLPLMQALMKVPAVYMMEDRDHKAFVYAAVGGHLHVMEALKIPDEKVAAIVSDYDYQIFRSAAKAGHLQVIEALLKAPGVDVREMVRANNCEAIHSAADGGHSLVMETILKALDVDTLSMIEAEVDRIFFNAVYDGHLQVIKALMNVPSVNVAEMEKADGYGAFYSAARHGHWHVMEALMNAPGMDVAAMVGAMNYGAFCAAVECGHTHVTKNLLAIPTQFVFAERHITEGPAFEQSILDFMTNKLASLRQRHEARHPTVVLTQEEAQICFYMLRHFIQQTPLTPETLADINFLMSIPIVRSILHRPITPDSPHNELLRESLRLGNQDMVSRLMDIPEVRARAEQDGFYPTESGGGSELRAIAQDHESSMSALSPLEERMLDRIRGRYKPETSAFNKMVASLAARYEAHPASFNNTRGEVVPLPLSMNAFRALGLSAEDEERAMEAYYQHPTHTAYRYLSKPNPWMDAASSFVNVDPRTGERWSTFDRYIELIVLLWEAASDKHAPGIEGYTPETRVEEFIRELALINRAHNWDETREKAGQPGVFEQYDDLRGDKPSCYSGVKRRLFQALKGHPLFSTDISLVISQALHQGVRDHMRAQLEGADTSVLEAVMIEYQKMVRGENPSVLVALTHSFDASAEAVDAWVADLKKVYESCIEPSILNKGISREQAQFFKPSKDSSQFLSLVEQCELCRLVEQTLEKRTDSLQSKIRNMPQDALADFLKTTDDITGESHFINAIHLGLLKEIGQRLRGDALTEILCPDDDTADAYASILADYADDARLDDWLGELHEPQKTALMDKIKASTSAYSFSAEEKLKMFLRSIESPTSSVKALMIGLSEHKSAPDFQQFLEEWIAANRNDTQALLIQQKCAELGFIPESATAAAEASGTSVTAVTPRNLTRPPLTYDDLPSDPYGFQLTEMLATSTHTPDPQPPRSPTSGSSMRDTVRRAYA